MSKTGLIVIGTLVKIYLAILLILLVVYALRKLTSHKSTSVSEVLKDIGIIVIFPIAALNNVMWNRLVNIFRRRK